MFDATVPSTYLVWLDEIVRRWNLAVDHIYGGDDQHEALRSLRASLLGTPAPDRYTLAQHSLVQLIDITIVWHRMPSDTRWRQVEMASAQTQAHLISLRHSLGQHTARLQA